MSYIRDEFKGISFSKKCLFIEGNPKPFTPEIFCGKPTYAGSSWCPLHHARVFQNSPFRHLITETENQSKAEVKELEIETTQEVEIKGLEIIETENTGIEEISEIDPVNE